METIIERIDKHLGKQVLNEANESITMFAIAKEGGKSRYVKEEFGYLYDGSGSSVRVASDPAKAKLYGEEIYAQRVMDRAIKDAKEEYSRQPTFRIVPVKMKFGRG